MIPNHLRKFHFDDDGRPLSRSERMQRYAQSFPGEHEAAQTEIPSGKFSERQAARKKAEQMAAEIARRLDEKAAESRPPSNPYTPLVAELREKRKTALPHERGAIDRRLQLYTDAERKWNDERAAAERRKEFEASPEFALMREHAEAFARSYRASHPDASQEDIDFALAVAGSDAFATPAAQAREYWRAIAKIEETQHAAELERMEHATRQAAEHAQTFAAQKQRVAESEQRLAKVQEVNDGE